MSRISRIGRSRFMEHMWLLIAVVGICIVVFKIVGSTNDVPRMNACPKGMVTKTPVSGGEPGLVECYSRSASISGPTIFITRNASPDSPNFYTATRAFRRDDGKLEIYRWAAGNHGLKVVNRQTLFRKECKEKAAKGYLPVHPSVAKKAEVRYRRALQLSGPTQLLLDRR